MFNQKTITNRRRRKSLGAQLADCASSRCGAGGNTTSLVGGNVVASDAWPIGEVAT